MYIVTVATMLLMHDCAMVWRRWLLKYVLSYVRHWRVKKCCVYYSYFIITVGENVLKVPLNIHTFLERVGIELLKRLQPSIVILLLTTIGSSHTATFNWEGNLKWRNTSKAPKAVSLQHMKLTTTRPCLGEVTDTVTHTTHSSVEWDTFGWR
jgi:hypothetical protein